MDNNILTYNNTKNEYMLQCVVEEGYKTCYIDSLLAGLFYKNNQNLDILLNELPETSSAIYLQELIKENFVDPIRKHFSISKSNINEIKNYILINLKIENIDIFSQQDIGKFYKYLINLLGGDTLQFEIFELVENNIKTINTALNLSYISLNPIQNTTIKELFINWLNKYIIKDNNKFCYKLIKIPQYISFYINRYNNDGFKNDYEIDIMRKIKFFNNTDTTQKNITWKIHCIICNSSIDTLDNSHYYSIISDYRNNWIIFDNKKKPSLQYIDMSDADIIEKIKRECMLIIYVLND